MSYYRLELSASDKGGYRVQGTPLDVCAVSKDDIKTLGFPEGTIMHVIGVYEASAEDKLELQVVRPRRDLCLMGLGALGCLSWPCYARKPSHPELNDVLAVIEKSPEYQGLRDQLLSETPEDAWYTSSQDMQFAIVVFTMKRDVRDPDHFVIYPSVMFFVDHVNRIILDVVISQVDEATLDRAFLTSLKDPAYHETVALNPAVTEELRKAKQERKVKFIGNQLLSDTRSQAHTAFKAMGA